MTGLERDPEAGVTLIEMLVAVAISALIGLAGFGMLDAILRVNARTESGLDRFADLDRAFFVIGRDLLAADASNIRLTDAGLSLTTPEETMVKYIMGDSSLERAFVSSDVKQKLVSGVQATDWRILDAGNVWRESWDGNTPDVPGPRAVELRLELMAPRAGDLRRLFLLTPGQAP